MHRFSILLVILISSLRAGEATAAPSHVSDRTLRFVNNHVITLGDMKRQNAIRIQFYRKSGQVLPETDEELIRFCKQSLEEITDETLLVQKADELKVSINRDRLANEVVDFARSNGLLLRDMSVYRTMRERKLKIDSVLDWFGSRAALVSPSEIASSYQQHIADFTHPPRAKSLLFALHPTPPDERQELVKLMARAMRFAQGATAEVVRRPAASRLDAFLAAEGSAQEDLLEVIVTEIAALVEQQDLNREDRELVLETGKLLTRWRTIRTREQCEQAAAALRTELAALPVGQRASVFRARAKESSQGPHAADGGELGWVEPKTFGAEIEEQALALPAGEISAPFWTGGSIALLLVLEREAGRTQEFAEVSSLLQAGLRSDRDILVRNRLIAVLRRQASIKDLVSVEDAFR